jgi:hypothetical protein
MLLAHGAVFMIKPSNEAGSRKTGRVGSKIHFNGFQGQAGLGYQ